jgi:O-antigen ligase
LNASGPLLSILALWLLLGIVQIMPLPDEWVAVLSPESHRMHALVRGVAGAPTTLSLDAFASRVALLKSMAYVSIFFLLLALVNERSRVLLLARVLVVAGLAHSVYAVLMHLSNVTVDYFGTSTNHGLWATGTYANRNHFAGYLEMTLALGIGLLIAELSERKARTWKEFASDTIAWVLSGRMIMRLSLCILVIALTTTHSRMGNIAFFSSLLVAGAIGIALSRRATRNAVILLASLVVIDLAIVGSWFGVERLAQRFEETTPLEVQKREEPALYTLRLIRDYPVFGSGAGSFYAVFPRYRTEDVADFYDYAHNDYAQIAAEYGLAGIGLLAIFVAACAAAALVAQWQRQDPLMRGMSFASLMGVGALLIHSLADFNLQIPANAALFMVMLGLGWISLHLERGAALAADASPAA